MPSIINSVQSLQSDIDAIEHHRLKSWNHCYSFFQNDIDDGNIDLACLHLGFYLASWGMYRGSSFLLSYDYKIHKDVILLVMSDRYRPLRHISFGDYTPENTKLLFELDNKIRGIYERKMTYETGAVTDTLITKILLGTLGCVPAYDRFFRLGIQKAGLPLKSNHKFSEQNFQILLNWCHDNKTEIDTVMNDIPTCKNYPQMKIIDMYFWTIGYKKS